MRGTALPETAIVLTAILAMIYQFSNSALSAISK
jgi:hypothetical protein